MTAKLSMRCPQLLFACFLSVFAFGQTQPAKQFGRNITETIPCGYAEYSGYMQQRDRASPSTQFEAWMAPKAATEKQKRLQKNFPGSNFVIIPVVVHIIHNGDAVGTDENISYEQIVSQLTVLNQDFRRVAATRGFNIHPDGANMEIEFRLAQSDPNGLKTTGIIRHQMSASNQHGWDMARIESEIKPQTQWDPNQYLNIWVVDYIYYQDVYQLAGYAQFPTHPGLGGLDANGAAITDGLVMGHKFFGSSEIYPQGTYDTYSNLGRSTTHEMGHFFGLKHIWGDGDCNATDYCEDTPPAAAPNTGCPTGIDSCPLPGEDMIENYMDYTGDACKNLFTLDQKDRIKAVLAYSPRRASLTTSMAWVPVILMPDEASVEVKPATGCTALTPAITLRNRGSNALTSATLTYDIDGTNTKTYTWTGNLAYGEAASVELPGETMLPGEHLLNVSLASVNNTQALNPAIKTNSLTVTDNFLTEEITVTVKAPLLTKAVYWSLNDSNGETITSGRLENNKTTEWQVPLENGCYSFALADEAGEPVTFDFGEGFYKITTADGQIINQTGGIVNGSFKFGLSSLTEAGSMSDITAYPNPAGNELNISLSGTARPEKYSIYNAFGQLLGTSAVNSQTLRIDTSSYASGLYYMKFEKGEESATVKFIKK